jgi:hypothetical protein
MARVYHRDANGRFASGGGGSSKGRPATTKASMRGGQNRLTRDNSGRITSIGGNGATARGGRLKTAAGNQRGRQVAKVKGGVKGTVSKNKRRDLKAPQVSKVRTDLNAIKERRQRALAPKNATYLSQKLNTRSAVVRSAANAIYNRQSRGVKELFGGKKAPAEVVKDPIGIMPLAAKKGSGRPTKKDRALANLEAARRRVISGRKGRR